MDKTYKYQMRHIHELETTQNSRICDLTYISHIREIYGHSGQTLMACMTAVSHILDPGEAWVNGL